MRPGTALSAILTLLGISFATLFVSVNSCASIARRFIYRIPEETTIENAILPESGLVSVQFGKRELKGLFCRGGSRLAVIFHGNGDTINDEMKAARRFFDGGYSVLLPEYPGFGLSKRYSPSEKSIYADASALLGYIQEKYGFAPADTVLYGRSLGAAIAVEMALRHAGSSLILVCPFSSMNELFVYYHAPAWIIPLINDQLYANLLKASRIRIPTLIVASSGDTKIPCRMSDRLATSFPDSTLIILDSASHGSIYADFSDDLWDRIVSFPYIR